MNKSQKKFVKQVNKKKRLLFVLPALILPYFASIFYFDILSGSLLGKGIYGFIKFFGLIWPIFVFFCVFQNSFNQIIREIFSKNYIKKAKSTIPAGLTLGFFISALIFLLVYFSPLGEVVKSSGKQIFKKANELGIAKTFLHFCTFALVISFVHSLLEEYYWRWFCYGQLREFFAHKPFLAHFIAGLAFSAHHIVVTCQFFPMWFGVFVGSMVGIGGILWSLLYQKQNNICGAWFSHILVDLAIMWVGWDFAIKFYV